MKMFQLQREMIIYLGQTNEDVSTAKRNDYISWSDK